MEALHGEAGQGSPAGRQPSSASFPSAGMWHCRRSDTVPWGPATHLPCGAQAGTPVTGVAPDRCALLSQGTRRLQGALSVLLTLKCAHLLGTRAAVAPCSFVTRHALPGILASGVRLCPHRGEQAEPGCWLPRQWAFLSGGRCLGPQSSGLSWARWAPMPEGSVATCVACAVPTQACCRHCVDANGLCHCRAFSKCQEGRGLLGPPTSWSDQDGAWLFCKGKNGV